MKFMPMMDAETLLQNLQQFCGTEQYYRHFLGIHYTDGVKYLAQNAQAYWLIDAIGSYQPQLQRTQRLREFQVWYLHVGDTHEFIKPTAGNTAVLTCWEDMPTADTKPAFIQQIPFTDFPLPQIKLYLQEKVLLLPSGN